MDLSFWDLLNAYKCSEDHKRARSFIKENKQKFNEGYRQIHELVNNKMFSPEVNVNGVTPFTKYVGADDGHDDLIDYIIWNGKETVDNFLADPKSAVPLAKKMTKNPNFSGDINTLKRLSYLTE